MMSAVECFANAQRCEKGARASPDDLNRRLLLDAAKTWRSLAEASKAAETAMYPPHAPPTRPT